MTTSPPCGQKKSLHLKSPILTRPYMVWENPPRMLLQMAHCSHGRSHRWCIVLTHRFMSSSGTWHTMAPHSDGSIVSIFPMSSPPLDPPMIPRRGVDVTPRAMRSLPPDTHARGYYETTRVTIDQPFPLPHCTYDLTMVRSRAHKSESLIQTADPNGEAICSTIGGACTLAHWTAIGSGTHFTLPRTRCSMHPLVGTKICPTNR